jgi:dephospho-CoA kinase
MSVHIGLTGRMAAGKGEAVGVLKERGFRYISLSDIVRAEAARSGGTVDRLAMQAIGNRLRAEGGAGVLGQRVRQQIEAAAPGSWVIDGIRNPAEVGELRRLPGFQLIGIDAPLPLLLERMRARRRASDALDDQALTEALAREWGEGQPADGQQVGACMLLADFVIINDTSLAEFATRLGQLLHMLAGS